MTKISTILLIVFPVWGFSQTDEIAEWQKTHPRVILIEVNDFTPKFEKSLIAQNQDYIVYDYEVSIDQLIAFDSNSYKKSSLIEGKDDDEKQIIKDWLGENQSIKIVTQSNFENEGKANRDYLMSINALILQGETLTAQDIENYEASH